MVRPRTNRSANPGDRSSVIVLVLVSMAFTAAALTAFIEKAGNDLLVEVRQADAKRLRQEAFSALEVTLAVLEDFRQADGGLHSSSEGWGDPLGWAGWEPSEGRTAEVTFQDESGKIPLRHADMTTLTNLFLYWQMSPADAEKLADALEGWMQNGYVYTSAITPNYDDAEIPYAEPARPMRSFGELAAVYYAKDVFFDENGLPNDLYWRFVNDVSIFNYSQPNANGANEDVMASVGQYTDAQRQHIGDYLSGTGQYAQQGQNYFMNATTLGAVAGLGGNANVFGTTITALRVNVTVHDGRSQFRLSAVVSPQGGATINMTNATNPNSADSSSSKTAAPTSVTATAKPSATATSAQTAAAASQSINYPFTILEMLEDDEIPLQPPPPLPQP
jgi:Type II secretion system (T2SS), protein K